VRLSRIIGSAGEAAMESVEKSLAEMSNPAKVQDFFRSEGNLKVNHANIRLMRNPYFLKELCKV